MINTLNIAKDLEPTVEQRTDNPNQANDEQDEGEEKMHRWILVFACCCHSTSRREEGGLWFEGPQDEPEHQE